MTQQEEREARRRAARDLFASNLRAQFTSAKSMLANLEANIAKGAEISQPRRLERLRIRLIELEREVQVAEAAIYGGAH
jgi:signal transduction histidine kinase